MREKSNMHRTPKNGKRTFAASFALWITVLILAVSPLTSCKDSGESGNSAKPEELLKNEYFTFAGIDENWIYYEIQSEDSTTFWRANKDGTGKSALVVDKEIDPTNFTTADGRLYYTLKSYDDINKLYDGIYSSPNDLSETTVVTGKAYSYYYHPTVSGEWLYFFRTDKNVLPDEEIQYAHVVCRVKLDGSDMSEIATYHNTLYSDIGDVLDLYNSPLVVGSRIYYTRSVEGGWAIAMRDVQGSEETIICSWDASTYPGPIRYSNGSIYYSHSSQNDEGYLICSVGTEAPYAQKTLLTEPDIDKAFDVAFAENGWVYYQKWDKTFSAPNELWRIRTDGTGAELLVNGAYYLSNDGGYIYYETYDRPGSTLYRMKTP